MRRLEAITHKLNSRSGNVELSEAINAEGPDVDRRLAAAIESYLPEMSRYLNAVERLHPPRLCDARRVLRKVLPLLHGGTSQEVNLYFVRTAPAIEADKSGWKLQALHFVVAATPAELLAPTPQPPNSSSAKGAAR